MTNRPSRRAVLAGAGALVFRSAARAQPPGRVFRLGVMHPMLTLTPTHPLGQVLVAALTRRGYVVGETLDIDAVSPVGDFRKLPALIDGFRARGVAVVLSMGYPPTQALKEARFPTVCFGGVGDPVETGLIETLAHPGGVVTGIGDEVGALTTKRLALLRELSPGMRSVAMLWNQDDLGMTRRYEASARMAQASGIVVKSLGVRAPDDFSAAFATMDADRPDAILMVTDALTNLNRRRVFDYASRKFIPVIYETEAFVRDGGLMSYGADTEESLERAAALADAVFRGARPGDLPFEQNTRFRFMLNLKTAAALGIAVPSSLLARADEVIE